MDIHTRIRKVTYFIRIHILDVNVFVILVRRYLSVYSRKYRLRAFIRYRVFTRIRILYV